MSEFSNPQPTLTTKTRLSSLLLSDFLRLCSFLLHHPLYLSYLIFFVPYLFKILSFISPLFITTSLLLALLATLLPSIVHGGSGTEHKPSSLLEALSIDGLRSHETQEESAWFEELEVYRIVFEPCPPELSAEFSDSESRPKCPESHEAFVDKFCSHESRGDTNVEVTKQISDMSSSVETPLLKAEGDGRKCLLEDEEVKPLGAASDKVGVLKSEWSKKSGSNAKDSDKISDAKVIDDNDCGELTSKAQDSNPFLGKRELSREEKPPKIGEPSFRSLGSMRKEKEWRRTLACKLFEERHNNVESGGGGEGMDLLWETYEAEANNLPRTKTTKTSSRGRHADEEQCEEDDDEDSDDGQLCCLQALKFSTGKMRLGMGRPGLVKISKALKGFGWLHHVSKQSKKG